MTPADFFRNPRTGELVIAQRPNLPLTIFLVATGVRLVAPDETMRTVAGAVGSAALAWWSVDEIVRGESPFRRVLGAVVLGCLIVSRVR